jgi:hypothetical protein
MCRHSPHQELLIQCLPLAVGSILWELHHQQKGVIKRLRRHALDDKLYNRVHENANNIVDSLYPRHQRIVCVVSESTGHARRTTLNDHTICVGNHVGAKPNMRCKCSVRVLDQVLVVSPGKGHRAHQIEMTQLESHHRPVTEDILGP